jgi:hypothetical protein
MVAALREEERVERLRGGGRREDARFKNRQRNKEWDVP